MNAHEAALKGQAKRLRSALAEDGVVLGHRKTLDLIARLHGWRNWHVLSAALDHHQPMATGLTLLPEPAPQKETITVTKRPDGTVPTYLKTTLTMTDRTPIVDMFNALPATVGNWQRDAESEARTLEVGGVYVYFVRQDAKEPLLAFAVSDDGHSAYVANIVPQPGGERITLKEANSLEAELVGLLRPLVPTTVRITQNAPTRHLRDLLQPATYQQFQHHSANKSTGNSHPNDRRRWLAFVAQAAQEGLDDRDEHVTLVRQALLAEGFADRHATEISQDYAIQVEAMRFVIG